MSGKKVFFGSWLFVLLATVIILPVYSGLFRTVEVVRSSKEGFTMIYTSVEGNLEELGLVNGGLEKWVTENIGKDGLDVGVDILLGKDEITFTSPAIRAIIGYALTPEQAAKLEGKKLPDHYKVGDIPSFSAVYTSFPDKTWLSGVTALYKVYPVLRDFVDAGEGLIWDASIEIYYENGAGDGLFHFYIPQDLPQGLLEKMFEGSLKKEWRKQPLNLRVAFRRAD